VKPIYSFLKSRRLWGLAGTAAGLYFLVFIVFGRIDMSWIMPNTNQLALRLIDDWRTLPFFDVRTEKVQSGKGHEEGQYIYYTVPTRQFTAKELAQMGMTNAVAHPAGPK
jgi:hypothetical protein